MPIKSTLLKFKTSSTSRAKDSSAGRRRDSTKHQNILQATRLLVEEKGYRGLSLKLIAARAGVSRNVLYNWWGGEINRIIEEALLPNVNEWPTPNHGNFKNDIEEFIELTIESINRPNVLKGFLILAAEVVNDEEELKQTTKYFRAPYARMVGKILKNAEARDEIIIGLDSKHVAQLICGSVMQFAISKSPGRRRSKTVLTEFVLKLASKSKQT